MEGREFGHVLAAMLMMFVVSVFGFVLVRGDVSSISQVFVFSVVVVGVPVFVKKAVAYLLDSSVEHEIWMVKKFGFSKKSTFKKGIPFGVLVPLVFSVASLGLVKVMTFLTYETSALKQRAAKRFGHYSYTSMTDWHNGLIGVSGVISLLVLSVVGYLPGWEVLAKMAAYSAFWNMIPIAKLDGTQIFFGSRVLWTVLAVTSLIFALFAVLIIV